MMVRSAILFLAFALPPDGFLMTVLLAVALPMMAPVVTPLLIVAPQLGFSVMIVPVPAAFSTRESLPVFPLFDGTLLPPAIPLSLMTLL
jgi:hypothetical protein